MSFTLGAANHDEHETHPIWLRGNCSSHGNSPAAPLDKAFPTGQGIVFHIPQDWEPVPKEILDQYSDALHKTAPGLEKQIYEYAFQKMPAETWFSYPYVMVQIKNKGRLPEAELKKYRAINKGLADGVKQLQAHAPSIRHTTCERSMTHQVTLCG